jgi:hypothetical protein
LWLISRPAAAAAGQVGVVKSLERDFHSRRSIDSALRTANEFCILTGGNFDLLPTRVQDVRVSHVWHVIKASILSLVLDVPGSIPGRRKLGAIVQEMSSLPGETQDNDFFLYLPNSLKNSATKFNLQNNF